MRILFLLLFSLLVMPAAVAQVKFCEIKYGEKDFVSPMRRRNFIGGLSSHPSQLCYKIGVEHNAQREPMLNRPIYACCRDFEKNSSF